MAQPVAETTRSLSTGQPPHCPGPQSSSLQMETLRVLQALVGPVGDDTVTVCDQPEDPKWQGARGTSLIQLTVPEQDGVFSFLLAAYCGFNVDCPHRLTCFNT